MKMLLEILEKKHLFFIDSLVAPHSTGVQLANELGIPAGSRDIFLDNIKQEEYILEQLRALIDISQRRGKAIGIGHSCPITLKVLSENLPCFLESVEFVHVSELLE
jgi:polysaccharide deacetylase 2 family uncharacterized protein YibQ